MRLSIVCVSIVSLSLALAADKKLPIETTSNELVEITANALIDTEQIRQELGSSLSAGIIVVRVRVRPLSENPVKIDRDDFVLLSDKDGQRSTPYAPSQIAGNSTLVVTQTGMRGSMAGAGNGPIWGGIPGTSGRPQRMPGNGGAVGGGPGAEGPLEAKVEAGAKSDKENPLLAVLKEKVLPQKEVTDPVTGLLYFQIEGKVKPKDLELYYKTPAGKLALRFRP